MEKTPMTPAQWGLSLIGQMSDAVRLAVEQIEVLAAENRVLKEKLAEFESRVDDGK